MKYIKEIITSKAFFRNYFLVCSACIGISIANIYSDYKEVPSSITLEEAEKKNLLKQNPAKEELLQAVKENRNIKEEYKQIFNRYIEKFCEEKEHIDKAILYQNIKDLQEIKIISKEELEKKQNEFTVMAISKRKKIIYIREDLYKKYKKALKELMKDENLSELYSKWNEINNEKLSLYYDNKNKTIPIEDNKEFRSIKNKIIQAVLNMDCKIPYAKWNYTDNGILLSNVISILADMFNINAQKKFNNLNNQIDKKQLSKEQEKRLAHGLKDLSTDCSYDNDYEENQGPKLFM